MVTERQIVAILGVMAAITTVAFAIYNLYNAFKPPQ
jgi:hypothetical protein